MEMDTIRMEHLWYIDSSTSTPWPGQSLGAGESYKPAWYAICTTAPQRLPRWSSYKITNPSRTREIVLEPNQLMEEGRVSEAVTSSGSPLQTCCYVCGVVARTSRTRSISRLLLRRRDTNDHSFMD